MSHPHFCSDTLLRPEAEIGSPECTRFCRRREWCRKVKIVKEGRQGKIPKFTAETSRKAPIREVNI
jgi:hypothetical protein